MKRSPFPRSSERGDALYWATRGCFGVETGNMVGPTQQGVETVIAKITDVWVGHTGASERPAPSAFLDTVILVR